MTRSSHALGTRTVELSRDKFQSTALTGKVKTFFIFALIARWVLHYPSLHLPIFRATRTFA